MSTEDPTTPFDQPELDPSARVRDEDPERPAESAEAAGPTEQTGQTEPSVSAPTPAAELLSDPDLGGDPNLLGSVDVTDEPAGVAGASADRPEELLDAPVPEQTPEAAEQTEQTEPAQDHRAHAAAAAAGPVMAPALGRSAGSGDPAGSPGQWGQNYSDQSHPAGSPSLPGLPYASGSPNLSDQESQALVKSSWRWAALTVFFFALLTIWAAPAAAMVNQRLGAGDVAGARAHAKTAKTLGVVSIVVFVVMMALWFFMMLALTAAGIEGFEAGAGGTTSTA